MANLRKQFEVEQRQNGSAESLKNPRVALYGRVSSDKQSKEQTIERQKSLTQAIFHGRFENSQLVGTYWDEGYNLEAKDETREFWRLAQTIEKGQVNTILCASEDRIFRGESAKLRGEITDLFRHNGVRLITSNSDTYYSRSETTDRLVTSIKQELGSINKLETVKTLQHGRRRKLLEQNSWGLSICPYGLRVDRKTVNHQKHYTYRIVETEAAIVRDIFRLYVGKKTTTLRTSTLTAGRMGTQKIAEVLNSNQVEREAWVAEASNGVGTEGWDKQKVMRILRNETYTGKLTVDFPPSTKVAGFQHLHTRKTIEIPAIVDNDLFEKAQFFYLNKRKQLLDDYRSRVVENWLQNLIQCPTCGKLLKGKRVASGLRYYFCPDSTQNTPHPAIRAEDVENEVERQLRILLIKLDFKKLHEEIHRHGESQRESNTLSLRKHEIEQKISQMKKKRMKLYQGWEDGLVDDDVYAARNATLKGELLQLETSYVELSQQLAANDDSLEGLLHLEQVKETLLGALLEPEVKEQILNLCARELLSHVELKHREPIVVTPDMPPQDILRHLQEGLVIAKQVRDALGLSPKSMIQKFGKFPRKSPMRHTPILVFKSQLRRAANLDVGTPSLQMSRDLCTFILSSH